MTVRELDLSPREEEIGMVYCATPGCSGLPADSSGESISKEHEHDLLGGKVITFSSTIGIHDDFDADKNFLLENAVAHDQDAHNGKGQVTVVLFKNRLNHRDQPNPGYSLRDAVEAARG